MANANAKRKSQFQCTLLQGENDLWVSDSGKLDREILSCGAFISNRARDNGYIASLCPRLYAARGADPNKRVSTDLNQFLDCNCR